MVTLVLEYPEMTGRVHLGSLESFVLYGHRLSCILTASFILSSKCIIYGII